MDTTTKFRANELANRISQCQTELLSLYRENGYCDEAARLGEKLSQISSGDRIKVVFVGPYTAGKSTIISALTGRKDVDIYSDITTSKATEYSWSGSVLLTDTPGLYTENDEHTQEAKQAIREADLLIYCITSDLFNQYTKKDFVHLAFESGYAKKMFLVINKMSKEAGEYDVLTRNYAITLNRSLNPHTIAEFTHSFVDAKDYKDGVASEDYALVQISHFEDFIVQLNQFIQRKGHLGKLDTPINILKSSIDDMSEKVIDDEQNRVFCQLLARIERKVEQRRSQVLVEARNTIRRNLRPIVDKGYELSQSLGIADIDFTEEDLNELVAACCEQLNDALCILAEDGVNSLNRDIESVMQSGVANYFFRSVEGAVSTKRGVFESRGKKISRAQFEAVSKVVEGITGQTVKLATKGGGASSKFLIKTSEASGSQLHKAVKIVGKTLKVKFKPWQAANIAKTIGNVAKFTGPVLSVIGFIFDAKEVIDDADRPARIYAKQLEYRQQFKDIYDDLEKQYGTEIDGLLSEFNRIIGKLNESRESVQGIIRANDQMTQKMHMIRRSLTEIQQEIF